MKAVCLDSKYFNRTYLEQLRREKIKRLKIKSIGERESINLELENVSVTDNGILMDYITKIIFFFSILFNNFVSAFADSKLSDLALSDAFVGNVKWLEKFNWVGTVVQAFISVFALFMLVTVFGQILITVIYFGNRPLWDAVYKLKQEKTGIVNYAFGDAFSGGFKATASKGSDVVMNFIMLFLPNIKKFSEMGVEGADEEMTLVTWLMSTLVNKVILLLVVSMAYNGSLLKGYLMITDGIGVVAEEIVETDLEGIIKNQIDKNNGRNYQFAVGSTGIGFDDLQGSVARKLYTQILKKSEDTSTNARNIIGSAVENYVTRDLTKDVIAQYIVPKVGDPSAMTDAEWERVKVEIVANTATSATNALTVRADYLGLQNSQKTATNYHIYFTLNRRDDTTSYWKVPDEN